MNMHAHTHIAHCIRFRSLFVAVLWCSRAPSFRGLVPRVIASLRSRWLACSVSLLLALIMADAEMSEMSDVESSAESEQSCNSAASQATTGTRGTRASRGSGSSKTKVKKKHVKKKKQKADSLAIQRCTTCNVLSTELDPLREHARVKHPDLERISIRWGKGTPKAGRVKKGKCYYCKRTHRAKKQYSSMDGKKLDEWVQEDESNRKAFVDDKEKTVQILIEKGDDCRIHERDFDRTIVVKKKERYGERSIQGGIKMTEAIFNQSYTAEEIKKLHFKKEKQVHAITGKEEMIVRIFDHPIGAERFEIYHDTGVEKEETVGDQHIGDADDAAEHFRSVAEDIHNPSSRRNALTAADIRAPNFGPKPNKDKKGQKRKLGRNDTVSSTCSRASSSSAPLGKMSKSVAKKLSQTPGKNKKAGKRGAASSPKGEGTSNSMPPPSSSSAAALDSPSSKPLQLFVKKVGNTIKESEAAFETLRACNNVSDVKDDAFLTPIRKLSGLEQKISENGLLYCKSAVTTQLSKLRACHNLVKSARGFEHKLNSNEVVPKESAEMSQAHKAFEANPVVKDVQLPWCVMALKQFAEYEFSFADPVHPKTKFPEAATF